MPLILGTNSIKDTGYDVANSLRFNRGSSDYLSRSTGVTTTNTKYTLSFWIKLCDISNFQRIFEVYKSSNERVDCGFNLDNSNQPRFFIQEYTGSYIYRKIFTRLSRDVSTWTHYVIKFDSSEAEANRLRVYINGVEETATDTVNLPSSGATSIISVGTQHIGYSQNNSGHYLNGYLAEFVLIEGTDYDPTSLGEFDEDSGIWKPIDVSGLTFGTNGFYLDFENSGSLGADVSGNGNNFTVNNLTAIDQSTDTCTNNFATLNPIQAALSSATFSEGNLKSVTAGTSGENFGGGSSIGVASGKWYFEAKATVGSGSADRNVIGVTGELSNIAYNKSYTGTSSTVQYQSYNGQVISNNTTTEYTGSTYATGDIIQIALDIDNLHVYFGKDGTWQNSGNPESGATGTGAVDLVALTSTTDGFYFIYHGDNSGASGPVSTFEFNFGSPSYSESGGNSDGNGYGNFNQSVPSGYYALNTKNLAEFGG